MKIALSVILLVLTTFGLAQAQDYAVGADLSFLKQAEDHGFEFKENGEIKPGLEIFKEHGYSWIRLRLFHTPTELPNNLEYTIALAKEAREMGYKFLLDYHYSDTWADPGKQYIPKAWVNLPFEDLVNEVYEYTLETMIAFRDAEVYPDMVQVGNEISNGFLWPHGKLPENWDNFAQLLRAGINGVTASCGDQPCPKIMVHIDKGGSKDFTKYWYDKLHAYDIRYDVIGQSYYPWWHGSLLDLKENMYFMATEYKKDIILVEVAYNWTPTEYKENAPPFEESPEGQKQFLEEVNRIVLNTPDNKGKGVFWWEPAVERQGSRSYFDEEGNVLPVITVFDKYTRH
uniref:Arabinogalactan endo-beta-1,4-galactanase n=1 Tax=Roseihalotalea indica TaxID=2867963 RepID=A0AA49GRL1_9BACT|nr:glycosyl hydrolase 53 family protein [Tunicatimonas sp. TK19036]